MQRRRIALSLLVIGCSDGNHSPLSEGTTHGTSSGPEGGGPGTSLGTTTSETSTGETSTGDTPPSAESTDAQTSTGAPSACGNSILEADEECDDGLDNGQYGHCAFDCGGPGPRCGDGVVNGVEACDELNQFDMDGCNTDCTESLAPIWILPTDPGVVYDLATSPDGRVFAAGSHYPSAWAISLDEDGNQLDWTEIASPTEGQTYFTGIAYGPDDLLWSVSSVFSPSGGYFHRIFGPSVIAFIAPGTFDAIAANAQGAFVRGQGNNGVVTIYRFSASAVYEWTRTPSDTSTCDDYNSYVRGPVISSSGGAVFACLGDADSWHVHRYSDEGDLLGVQDVDPPDDIDTIAIDSNDNLYFAGSGELGAYVSRAVWAGAGGGVAIEWAPHPRIALTGGSMRSSRSRGRSSARRAKARRR